MDSLQYVGSCKRSAPPAVVDGSYLDALMSYGINSGAVSPEDATRLGSEAYALVCGLCRRRTGGKSSSLPETAVRRIYASLSYTVGQDLSRRAPETAIAVLVRDGVDASRRRGRRIIERRLGRSCFYCGRAQRHRPETDNETYAILIKPPAADLIGVELARASAIKGSRQKPTAFYWWRWWDSEPRIAL